MVIVKWIKAIFTHPTQIIKGAYLNLRNKNRDLAQHRLCICSNCEYKTNIYKFGDICGICGCILKNKVTLPDAECDKGKW